MLKSGLEIEKKDGLWLEKSGHQQMLSHYYELKGVNFSQDQKVKKFIKTIAQFFDNRALGRFTVTIHPQNERVYLKISLRDPYDALLNDQAKQQNIYNLFGYLGRKLHYYLLCKQIDKKPPGEIDYDREMIRKYLNMIKFTRR